MRPASLAACHWSLFAGAAVTYLLMAMWRKDVSLRPLRLGSIASAAVIARFLLVVALAMAWWEWIAVALCLILVAAAHWTRQSWLIHADPREFRQRMDDACRGLRLEQREPSPGRLELVDRQQTSWLGVTVLFPAWLLVQLPRAARPSKVALLVDWLAKQYPGPVPRIHIRLSRES
jgi:hypothetical protein